MASRLINVRLAAEDGLLVRELRAHGVSISSVVRRAIRAEARKLRAEPVAADALLKAIMERYPTPAQASRVELDATDRQAVRTHILTRLHRRR
jgi:hypothetical protein